LACFFLLSVPNEKPSSLLQISGRA
jgi:hypothetical protein